MLVVKKPAGVAPGVNLRNPLRAGEEASKRDIHTGIEIQGRHPQKSKTGVSVTSRKGLILRYYYLKNEINV